MLRISLIFFTLSLVLSEAAASPEKITGLKFGDDGLSVVSFSPDMAPLAEHFSFCVWIKKINERFNNPVPFAYGQSQLFIYDHGSYRFFGVDGHISVTITPRTWYQYCGTWSLASRTFRAYINGTEVGTMNTPSGRKLTTGGKLIWGDYWDPNEKHKTQNHFGGEMYNFNMFSKELSRTEIARLSTKGLCTPVPEDLQPFKLIKWEEIVKLDRSGKVQDLLVGCEVGVHNHLTHFKSTVEGAGGPDMIVHQNGVF